MRKKDREVFEDRLPAEMKSLLDFLYLEGVADDGQLEFLDVPSHPNPIAISRLRTTSISYSYLQSRAESYKERVKHANILWNIYTGLVDTKDVQVFEEYEMTYKEIMDFTRFLVNDYGIDKEKEDITDEEKFADLTDEEEKFADPSDEEEGDTAN